MFYDSDDAAAAAAAADNNSGNVTLQLVGKNPYCEPIYHQIMEAKTNNVGHTNNCWTFHKC